MLRCAILGMFPHTSMYAALQPVPKMQPILTSRSAYADAMRVPVVSFTSAVSLMGRSYKVTKRCHRHMNIPEISMPLQTAARRHDLQPRQR